MNNKYSLINEYKVPRTVLEYSENYVALLLLIQSVVLCFKTNLVSNPEKVR